jgi:hypothetical protein
LGPACFFIFHPKEQHSTDFDNFVGVDGNFVENTVVHVDYRFFSGSSANGASARLFGI